MKKSLPTVVLLVTICVSAALALAQTMHNKATPRSRDELVRPASQPVEPRGLNEHLRTGSRCCAMMLGACVMVARRMSPIGRFLFVRALFLEAERLAVPSSDDGTTRH
jgi:hypothetical protein